MPSIPCLLCGHSLQKRTDKHEKPYFVCDLCGIQLFIRKQRGIERLEEVFKAIEKAQIPFKVHAKHLYEIQALIEEIEGVKEEIEKIGFSYWFDEDKTRIRNSLKSKLEGLQLQLEEIARKEEHELAEKNDL